MCDNSPDWLSTLPTILELHTAIKEDVGCCTAKLVYGTTLWLPGEFF